MSQSIVHFSHYQHIDPKLDICLSTVPEALSFEISSHKKAQLQINKSMNIKAGNHSVMKQFPKPSFQCQTP